MKILAIGDIHARPHNNFSTILKDNTTTYLEKVRKSLHFTKEQIEEEKPDLVAFLGDGTNEFGRCDAMTATLLKDEIGDIQHMCSNRKIMFTAIEGNHDVEKVGKPGMGYILYGAHYEVTEIGGMLLIPYLEGNYLTDELMQKVEDSEIILSHLDLTGGIYNAVKKSEGPDFSKYNVINGHIHQPSIYKNVVFTGSLLASTFKDVEVDQKRGIVIWNDGNVKWIENPHTDIFKKVLIKDEKDAVKLLNSLEKPKQTYLNIVTTNQIYQSKEVIELKEVVGGIVTSSILEDIEENDEVMDSKSLLSLSPEDVVGLYCDKYEIEGKDREYGESYLGEE